MAAGGLSAGGLVREAEWPEYRGFCASAVRDLPNLPEYGKLKARWKRLTGATLAADVLQFLRDIEGLAAPNDFEPDFFYRMQWLPYVGQAAHGGVRLWLLLGHARRWANDERPDRVGFRVETKWEEKECGING